MDFTALARTLAQAALALLAEAEESPPEVGPTLDPQVVERMRGALLQLAHTDPADLAKLESIAETLLHSRDFFNVRASAHHLELEAADASRSGSTGREWNRLLERHIAFAESAVLHGVTQTLLEHCGRRVGWAREWQVDMQPFRTRAESPAGHPGRIGRFVAVAKVRDSIQEHLLDLPEKDFDMLFRDSLWGIPFSTFRTLESGETWREFLDVAQVFDPARLERATQLYLQYVMVARAFHWPPDTFAVRLSYLARLSQFARPAVPA
jgi:hypothetical protein